MRDEELYVLTISGIDKERAKELAEDFGGGALMWYREGSSIIAYPSDQSVVEIKEVAG